MYFLIFVAVYFCMFTFRNQIINVTSFIKPYRRICFQYFFPYILKNVTNIYMLGIYELKVFLFPCIVILFIRNQTNTLINLYVP